jgi:phenylpyruvate tautomerase PptA (4-oxalocrotonate tautomerase family)
MPTYTVTTLEGCLDTSKRAEIASEITRIHSETTGAPTYFAQVIFTEIAPDRYFVGGSPLKAHQVFVNGQIRAGRSTESKDSLIMQITAAVAAASKLPKRNVWVYITDLVPRHRWSSSVMCFRKPAMRRDGLLRYLKPTGLTCRATLSDTNTNSTSE